MGRQYRSLKRGGSLGGSHFVQNAGPVSATSSSVVTAIPNYGMTVLSSTVTFPAGEYVLDAPQEGVLKTIVCVSGSSDARVIRLSPSTANNVTVNYGTPTTGTGGNTQITFNATVSATITLLGINSTHWAVYSMWPPTAVNSTGIVIAST